MQIDSEDWSLLLNDDTREAIKTERDGAEIERASLAKTLEAERKRHRQV